MPEGKPEKARKSDRWAFLRERPRKDGSTAYVVNYQPSAGKQSTITFDSAVDASAMVALIRAHGCQRALDMYGISPTARPPETTGPTVAEFIGAHIDELSGVERKTRSEYRRYLTRDIEPTLGLIPLGALTRADLCNWVNSLSEAGASGKTISNKFGFLAGALNSAVRDGQLRANPAVGIRLPRTVRPDMVCMTQDEYDILRAAFTPRWHALLDFLVTSGCRFSEATALQPCHIDRATNSARIRQAWKKIDGGYELGQPKTAKSLRTVRVPASVIDQLDLTGEWVFRNSQGEPIRLYSWRSNVWVKSLARAQNPDPKHPDRPLLDRHVKIHDLRHTAASWALSAGVPLLEVSAHLGHESATTTADIYGHLLPNAGQAVADAMAALLRPAQPLAGARG